MTVPFGIQMTIIKLSPELSKRGDEKMYQECITLMKQQGVEFAEGLSSDEIAAIEKHYGVKFPQSLKEFLMEALPVSKGFYNWRDLRSDNTDFIEQMIRYPLESFEEFASEVDWCEEWGDQPETLQELENIIRTRLRSAPKLIPLYSHRYIPVYSDNPPVFSVHGVDVIYYGENLEQYLNAEFGEKKQSQLNWKEIKCIPFWSDVM